jgi:thiamine biosynthesis lipoprotein
LSGLRTHDRVESAGSMLTPGIDNGEHHHPYRERQYLMDTVIEMIAYGDFAPGAVKAAFREFKRIQSLCDRFSPASQVSKINRMAGIAPVAVDDELIELICHANRLAEKLEGAFDITVGALTELWGIGHKDDFVPSQAEIDAILPLVNYRNMIIDNHTVFLPKKGMKIDLGGVAKGYALNRAIIILQAYKIESALVNAGGDIRILGGKPGGVPWRVGVQHPRQRDALIAKLTLTEWDTMETSGDYQRFYIKSGRRYAHIFNQRTGMQPTDLASVTLIYKDCPGTSNIASSGILTLGLAKGRRVLKRFPGVEAVFVTTGGEVVITAGLENKIEL